MSNRIQTLDPNVTGRLEALYGDYEQFMRSLVARKGVDLTQPLEHLVKDIQLLGLRYSDFLFCMILVDRTNMYSVRHPVLSALVCNMMATRFELDNDETFALISSALTANAGMFKVMDAFAEQSAPPSREQRELINSHPKVSVEMLATAQIRDSVILETVLKHHEKLDGSGYPQQLRGDEITQLSSLLSLTDVFCAMLLPRKYRDGIYNKQAIQHVFQQRSEKINPELCDHFVKEVGIYPPGVFVGLENGEEALVAARNPGNASRPLVVSFADVNGQKLPEPITRNTEFGEYKIDRSLPPTEPPFTLNRIYEVLSAYEEPAEEAVA